MAERRRVGFWANSRDPTLPKPKANKLPWEGQSEFLRGLLRMESAAARRIQKGVSTCRICKCDNMSAEYTNDKFVWPAGFVHYVREHNVKPDDEFIAAALSFLPKSDAETRAKQAIGVPVNSALVKLKRAYRERDGKTVTVAASVVRDILIENSLLKRKQSHVGSTGTGSKSRKHAKRGAKNSPIAKRRAGAG